jgi:hypothetical protein
MAEDETISEIMVLLVHFMQLLLHAYIVVTYAILKKKKHIYAIALKKELQIQLQFSIMKFIFAHQLVRYALQWIPLHIAAQNQYPTFLNLAC